MESLMVQMNAKLDKIMTLLEKQTISQGSQTDSSNTQQSFPPATVSIVRHPLYPVVSSQYARKERVYPLHLRYYNYHLDGLHEERENAIRKALTEYSKERILDRLTYLLDIWKRNEKKIYIDNLQHDIDFVSNIQ